ncbi:hypothetical protein JTE90_019735 [Oedothorax gibbosus]|uniref:Uncharacterized protein n=1 Tax=Oedothorax gibbosus TaxID=931172 RepID=A0AAV6UMX2_9ARAC|nr:hypothetical protein JTE90_019735 [Oedothorax gibbosus]
MSLVSSQSGQDQKRKSPVRGDPIGRGHASRFSDTPRSRSLGLFIGGEPTPPSDLLIGFANGDLIISDESREEEFFVL